MNPTANDLLECAIDAATAAATHATTNFSRRNQIAKTFHHDIKLALDSECQTKAVEVINSAFPDHAVLGEEDQDPKATPGEGSEYLWVIDPIDGSVNFMHGLSNWCCSIAVQCQGKTVAGAVYQPLSNSLFTASATQPAMLNSTPIKVSETSTLFSSLIMTGLDKNNGSTGQPFEIFRRISLNAQKTRVMGSAAMDLCQVACGNADGYFESGIYIWDISAAGFIIEKAGGKAEILYRQDSKRLTYLASNGLIHSALRNVIAGNKV